MAQVSNDGGIVNRGSKVTITGRAVGKSGGSDKDRSSDDKGGERNTGIMNLGGQITVSRSWVNGEWVE